MKKKGTVRRAKIGITDLRSIEYCFSTMRDRIVHGQWAVHRIFNARVKMTNPGRDLKKECRPR